MNMLNTQAPITIYHDEITTTKIWEIIIIVLQLYEDNYTYKKNSLVKNKSQQQQ